MKVFVQSIGLLLFFLLLTFSVRATEEERSFTIINAADGLADNSAQVVRCTKTGRIIISTIGNLNFYDGRTFKHANNLQEYEHPLPAYTGHYHLYFDTHHHIWLKDKHCVTCLDLLTERFVQDVDSVIYSLGCQDSVLDLFTDQYSKLWLLTEKGLFSPDYNRTHPVERDRQLQDIDIYEDTLYTFYDNGEVIGFDSANHVVCRVMPYDEALSTIYSASTVLQPFGDGFFQIRNGEKGAVLLFFNARERKYDVIAQLEYHLNNMTLDATGKNLYIPSEYGYWVYNPETKNLHHYKDLMLADGQTISTDCNAMAFDHQGGLWIGTEKRGIFYARPHSVTFRAYPWSNQLALEYGEMMDSLQQNISYYNGIRANYRFTDSRGWVWTGTRRGVFIEKPGASRPETYNRQKGLNNEVIHSIIEDLNHNVWAATSCGIVFFLIKDGEVKFVNNFTSEDNVPNESFENGKAMLLPDGTVVMQAVEHVVAFNPDELRDVNEPHLISNIKPKFIRMLVNGNNIIPGVPYEDNMVVDRAFARTQHINLNSSQNSISLTFSALNYFRPLQTYYRVRVYELGNKWVVYSPMSSELVDSKGILHFPMANLEPGDYHVEVQASMFPDVWDDDISDDQRFVWQIHVKQPWWRTTGLMMLLGLVLLVLLIINFYYYNRNTRMRDRRNTEEGDIIRKIRFFVERCDSYLNKPLAPVVADVSISSYEVNPLSPEFIDVMMKLLPYVRSHQGRTLTMRNLCVEGNVDIVKLYDLMTGNLHKNPRELNRIIRLRKGAELLLTTDKTVEQIAIESGFYTPNYFIGNFFHEYKQTPMEYRHSHLSKY